jgi:hypothetical protein
MALMDLHPRSASVLAEALRRTDDELLFRVRMGEPLEVLPAAGHAPPAT